MINNNKIILNYNLLWRYRGELSKKTVAKHKNRNQLRCKNPAGSVRGKMEKTLQRQAGSPVQRHRAVIFYDAGNPDGTGFPDSIK